MNKYSDELMEILRQREDLNRNDTSLDDTINEMSPDEVFKSVLEWEGFLGYEETIKNWISDIYHVDL